MLSCECSLETLEFIGKFVVSLLKNIRLTQREEVTSSSSVVKLGRVGRHRFMLAANLQRNVR
jgi:hypothetical protein